MRIAVVLLAACAADDSPLDGRFEGTKTYSFDHDLAPNQQPSTHCVQISLGNEEFVNVNAIELTTERLGFDHSSWFIVPDFVFPGEDGTYNCDERGFLPRIAATKGVVILATSTGVTRAVQRFPEGVVLHIPPRHKLVAQIGAHNPSNDAIELRPTVDVSYIMDEDVTARLASVVFENAALALPPMMSSKFTVECDLIAPHQNALNRPPDFKIYDVFAHHHDLGTKAIVEAVKSSGESTVVYSTAAEPHDVVGGPIEPAFDFTSYAKLRFSCEYYNPRTDVVKRGDGDQEVCVFYGLSDSQYIFGGGVLDDEEPQNPVMVGNTMTYENQCGVVFTFDSDGRGPALDPLPPPPTSPPNPNAKEVNGCGGGTTYASVTRGGTGWLAALLAVAFAVRRRRAR